MDRCGETVFEGSEFVVKSKGNACYSRQVFLFVSLIDGYDRGNIGNYWKTLYYTNCCKSMKKILQYTY